MSRPLSSRHFIYTLAVIGFIYTLHAVLPMYSNSSFLSLYMNEAAVGYVYMLGAAISILAFLIAPNIIRRLGNYNTAMLLVCLQIALFYGMLSTQNAVAIAILFALQSALISLIGLTIDIFLEGYTDRSQTGAIRGFYTAILNASWVIAPLLGSILIDGLDNYRNTYIAALAMLFPLLYLIHRNFPRFKDPKYIHLSPVKLVQHISGNHSWVRLLVANTVLQTFYAWMVVYSPIYLNKVVGFDWSEIGIILTIMLIPFPIIQYPLGKLSDRKDIGQRKIMAAGFAIMGLSTIGLSLITSHSVAVWAAVFFLTRVGAAAAEIMIETYFFKTVSERDSAVLGIFRVTRPVSYFLAPIVTMIGLYFTSNEYLFAVIGMISLLAVIPASRIHDVK